MGLTLSKHTDCHHQGRSGIVCQRDLKHRKDAEEKTCEVDSGKHRRDNYNYLANLQVDGGVEVSAGLPQPEQLITLPPQLVGVQACVVLDDIKLLAAT